MVTDYGIAVNPNREDILQCLKHTNLPICSVYDLKEKAEKIAGKPEPVELSDEICGIVEYRDGSIIDVVHQLV